MKKYSIYILIVIGAAFVGSELTRKPRNIKKNDLTGYEETTPKSEKKLLNPLFKSRLIRIKNPGKLLNGEVEIQLQVFDPPIFVTGGVISNSSFEWAEGFKKCALPFQMTFDEYETSTTDDYRKMTGIKDLGKFEEARKRYLSMASTRPPLNSTILWSILVKSQQDIYLVLAEVGGAHLKKEHVDHVNQAEVTARLLRKDDGAWLVEGLNHFEKDRLGLLPWNNLTALRNLLDADSAIVENGKLTPSK